MPRQQNQPTADEVEAGEPGGVGTELPPLLGVPEGFRASRTERRQSRTTQYQRRPGEEFPEGGKPSGQPFDFTYQVTATFRDGHQWIPSTWGPERIAVLQREMLAAGLVDTVRSLGYWDDSSAIAFANLLAFANQAGYRSYKDALRHRAKIHEEVGVLGAEEELPPLEIRRSNPDELGRVFRGAVIEKLGMAWDSSRIDRMVNDYLAEEERVQREAYGESVAGGTVDVTDIPSPETFAQQQVEEEDPTGVAARRGLDFEEEFFAALGGVV